MNKILLLGEDNKRYFYLKKAGDFYNTTINLLKWDDFSLDKIKGKVKIDPPLYRDKNIEEHNKSLKIYRKRLIELSKLQDIYFLNSPKNILELLDKKLSKEKLNRIGVSVTPILNIKFDNFNELYEKLKELNCKRVFLKPRYGSGAMGIIAMQVNFKLEDIIFYTTLDYKNNELINTKNIIKIQGFKKCETLFNILFNSLEKEIIVEKWIIKDKFMNQNYDLRVLYDNKEIIHIIGRASQGPITNLHLNNGKFDYKKLNLSEDILLELEKIGNSIYKIFPDLKVVGVDILITPKKELFVIELNGQGDQLYSDMYNENKIYKKQIKELLDYE